MRTTRVLFAIVGLPFLLGIDACAPEPPTFWQVRGYDQAIHNVLPNPDGSAWVSGVFDTHDREARHRMSLVDADGSPSADYAGGAGFSGLHIPFSGPPGTSVSAMAHAPDGSGDVYAGGNFAAYDGTPVNGLVRLNADGTIDTGFSSGAGFAGGVVSAIVPAGGGSTDIYVVGNFQTYNGAPSRGVIRLNNDGTIDTGFNVGSGFGGFFIIFRAAAANDGSGDLYVSGEFSSYNGATAIRVARLNADGSLDTAFATGSSLNTFAGPVVPAEDGSGDVYVGGQFTVYNGATTGQVVRLNADGSRDPGFAVGAGFGSAGETPAFSFVQTLLAATDGSGDVFAGGRFNSYNGAPANRAVRLNPDGSIDPSFNVGAGIPAEGQNHVAKIAYAGDGSGDVYLCGNFVAFQGQGVNNLVRLDADGSIDAGWEGLAGFDWSVAALAPALDGSGDIYAAGEFGWHDGVSTRRIARLNANGTRDPAFNVGTGFNAFVWDLAVARDGSGDVYVAGNFTTCNTSSCARLARLNADGSLDTVFATGTGFDAAATVVTPARDGSGDVYVGGFFTTYNGATCGRLVRLNADGTIDAAFNTGTGFSGTGAVVRALAIPLNGSGDVYVAGTFAAYNGATVGSIVRLNADGTMDAAFAAGAGFDGAVWTLAMAGQDVYVGGDFANYNAVAAPRLVRLNADGTADAAFNAGATFAGPVTALAVTLTGKVYAGGDVLRRLNANGTIDAGFNTGTGFVKFPLFDSAVGHDNLFGDVAVANDGSGDVFVGGKFVSYDHQVVDWRVRLTSDGNVR